MTQGAYSVHKEIKKELENYIKTQYFGKTPLLFSALRNELSREGVLYREPYIESSPAYQQEEAGFLEASIENWMKEMFRDFADNGLGVYRKPFKHQLDALEAWTKRRDIFVSTGTGSGKTECFMWPLVAKLIKEAKELKTWEKRGVRVMIMYPMNALVSDQLGRLRRLIGDPNDVFLDLFRKYAGAASRRPQFGMYTGRSPYPGEESKRTNDKRLAETYRGMLRPPESDEQATEYYNLLLKEGRIPAKKNLGAFIERLEKGDHVPDTEDAELLTRFEIQKYCPDILITNYSMLEYMLLRPREAKIWSDTKDWLRSDDENRLLFIIDEAHMYRGSAGGEVALLIRRLLHKLEIGVDRVQFILTTASMPNSSEEDKIAVEKFAFDLTGKEDFVYIFGKKQGVQGLGEKELAYIEPEDDLIESIEAEDTRLDGLNKYWGQATNGEVAFTSVHDAERWMYDHLCEYKAFAKLIESCRGTTVSISDLAAQIYPDKKSGEAAVSLLISVAQLAKSDEGMVLFPAKMHLLFRGLKGVFACTNKNCAHSHTDNGVKLGEILIDDGNMICPVCGSSVYELYQDRRCGALFFKGYIVEEEMEKGRAYLWHYPGQLTDQKMYELHLYIPPEGFYIQHKGENLERPCYLNIKSGFIDFLDDRHQDDPNYRKLYYSEYKSKDIPDLMTFASCPHCQKNMSRLRLTSFATKGNQSFNNLIKAQFNAEDPVGNRTKNPKRYPNEGRKVLLFSDSRQRAATLARDMSEEADISAARQLFMCALNRMMQQDKELSLDQIYGYFLYESVHHNVSIFDTKFKEDCARLEREESRNKRRSRRRQKQIDLSQYTISKNSGEDMQEQILRLYCGNYNTLIQDALSWIEPIDEVLENIIEDIGEELGVNLDNEIEYEKLEDKTIELFSAWFIDICDSNQAVGHTIPNSVRNRVRRNYKEGFGLKTDWKFSKVISQVNEWKNDSNEMKTFKRAFSNNLLERSNSASDSYFIKLDAVKPLYDPEHIWYKCKKCSEISPFLLNGKCSCCGSAEITEMSEMDYAALAFWRNPIEDAIAGASIRVIDTEEHTAQLSHKDQQDEMWSKTEEYEMRFQDMIRDNETPVDILSSTTTMEVGIDIGSLVAVGLRNIPPMRENYQQRAGRAGRRGSSLSTIVTFCENGPYDTLYFNKPVPMFRGDPRRPWVDTASKKLLHRHLNMLLIQEYLNNHFTIGMDTITAIEFIQDKSLEAFNGFLKDHQFDDKTMLLGESNVHFADSYKEDLQTSIRILRDKCQMHPELYTDAEGKGNKSLLDALYEEGIVPTYSFPKDVVSLYINDYKEKRPKIKYQVERGLDVAIGEYAPGRSIVVDKNTYQIGGLYYPGTEIKNPQSPAARFMEDPNYNKPIISCDECGWFGIQGTLIEKCPFCGNVELNYNELPMIRPWGFAPKDAKAYPNAQIDEEFSAMKEPLYSTLPSAEEMQDVIGHQNVRKSIRTDQSIIMLNKGPAEEGFTLCPDCGAIMPAEHQNALKRVYRPYKIQSGSNQCPHSNAMDVNLGYELKTDMLVLEYKLNKDLIDTRMTHNLWLTRAAASLAEGIRLVAGEKLDIEFTELITGHRIRDNQRGTFIDIYIYDSLSSGAGYSDYLSGYIEDLLQDTYEYLSKCNCSSACYDCLKHYRNQRIHGRLDRQAAINLLDWGMDSKLADELSVSQQWELLNPLESILYEAGIKLAVDQNRIIATEDGISKELIVYPAMRRKRSRQGEIFVSDYMIKYAKPTAVEYILNGF